MNKTKIIEKLELDELSLKILNSALSYYDENYELIDLSDYPLLKNKKELNLFENKFNTINKHGAKINSNHDCCLQFCSQFLFWDIF